MTTYEAETQLDAYMGQLNTDVADFDNTAKAMGAAVSATTENLAARIRIVSYLPLGGILFSIYLFFYSPVTAWLNLLPSVGISIYLILRDLTRGQRLRANMMQQQQALYDYIDNN